MVAPLMRQSLFSLLVGWKKDSEKDLQTCGAGRKSRKSRKRPTPAVGKKANGKCQLINPHEHQ
jgi:hypothetical protein